MNLASQCPRVEFDPKCPKYLWKFSEWRKPRLMLKKSPKAPLLSKGKKISKWPLHFFQLWFIFNKVTNYVKKITPELVSLKIGAFFAFFSSKWDICRSWVSSFSLCAKNSKNATGPCRGSVPRCGLIYLPLVLPTNLLLITKAFSNKCWFASIIPSNDLISICLHQKKGANFQTDKLRSNIFYIICHFVEDEPNLI